MMRRTPLARGTTKLHSGLSTTTPTKAEKAHIEAIKASECICCVINRSKGYATAFFGGCDAHHTLSGGRRRGHAKTLGVCPWHHRGVKPYDGMTDTQATETFGPSLAGGSKPFHAFYGTDDELLAMQAQGITA